jgi:hypothetical protein
MILNCEGSKAELETVVVLPELGRDAFQEAIEPLLRIRIEKSTGVFPLTDPELARSFYRILHGYCDQLATGTAGRELPWQGKQVNLPHELFEEPLARLAREAALALEQQLTSRGLGCDQAILLPSALLATPWGGFSQSRRGPFSAANALPLRAEEYPIHPVMHAWTAPTRDATVPVQGKTGVLVSRAVLVSIALLLTSLAAFGVWFLMDRDRVGRSGGIGPAAGPHEAPGVYLTRTVRSGTRITMEMISVTTGVSQDGAPTEDRHVIGAFAIEDLESGHPIAWTELSAFAPTP